VLAWIALVNTLLMAMAAPIGTPWQLVKEATDTAQADVDHKVAHSGTASAHLTVAKSTAHEVALLQPFRGESWRGKRVLLTGWVKTDLAGGEVGLVVITNNAGRYSIYCPTEQRVTKQTAWQELSVVCDVPADTTLMSIGAWVRHGNGSLWLDDLAFGPAPLDASAPPQPRRSPPLTRDQMAKVAETLKAAGAAPHDLDFEEP
jgi:hypothetical protein